MSSNLPDTVYELKGKVEDMQERLEELKTQSKIWGSEYDVGDWHGGDDTPFSVNRDGFDSFLNRDPTASRTSVDQLVYNSDVWDSITMNNRFLRGGIDGQRVKALYNWTTDITFSVDSDVQASWTAGNIVFGNGRTSGNISAGNTGDVGSDTTYIYYDDVGSQTNLQTTTDAGDVSGVNRILLAIFEPNNDATKLGILTVMRTTGLTVANLTADNISGDQLDVLAAKTGTLEVDESITMNAAGHIKGGQTGYDTGTGYWIGYDGGAYKFSIGDGSSKYVRWDGTNISWKAQNTELDTSGNLTATSATISGSITITGGSGISNLSDAGGLATKDAVGAADCDNTIISGGKIITGLLTADNIQAGTLTGRTVQTANSGARVVLDGSNNRIDIYDASNLVARLSGSSLDFYGDNANIYFNSGKTSYISDSGIAGGYVTFYGGGKLEIGGNSKYIRWGQTGYEDGVKFDAKIYDQEGIYVDHSLTSSGANITVLKHFDMNQKEIKDVDKLYVDFIYGATNYIYMEDHINCEGNDVFNVGGLECDSLTKDGAGNIAVNDHLDFPDDVGLVFGSGSDMSLTWDTTATDSLRFKNSGGSTLLRLYAAGTFQVINDLDVDGNIEVADDKYIKFGDGTDVRAYWDNTASRFRFINSSSSQMLQLDTSGNIDARGQLNMNNNNIVNATRIQFENSRQYINDNTDDIRIYFYDQAEFYRNNGIVAIIDQDFWTDGDVSAGGSKPFIIPYPGDDEGRWIRYTAQESPDVVLRIRGKGSLDSSGSGNVSLPDHFTKVTEEEGEITVNLTPIGDHRVYVLRVSNKELSVGGDGGAEFYYEVMAIRNGYLDSPVILENDKFSKGGGGLSTRREEV